MQPNTSFDMSNLMNSLKVSDAHKAFAHGQLKNAASKAIREYGYHWATMPIGSRTEESIRLMHLRNSIKKTIFQSTKGWHSNQSVVWKRFSDYVKKVGIRHETLLVNANMKNQISS